ncbi:MAG: STING domain-containing protein [Chthonomonadales bacterium]
MVKTIHERSKQSTLQLLPSTGLAIGYFNNFVLPVCQELNKLKMVKIGKRNVPLKPDSFDFTVVLPKDLSQASIYGAKKFVSAQGLLDFNLPTTGRPYPFYVSSKLHKGRVQFYDYPTTLNASQGAIRIALSGPFIGFSEHHTLLEKMEIANFQRAMESLLREPSAAEFADNVKFTQST